MASLGLWACAGLHGVMAAISVGQIATGQTGREGPLVIIKGLALMLYLFVFIATAVFVCMWSYRATQHALARGAVLDASTPADAVVSWFIPFLNFVRPFNITRGLLMSAGLEVASVNAWQAMWLIGGLASNAANRNPGTEGLGLGVLADLLLVGAAITAAQIVNRLKWPAA